MTSDKLVATWPLEKTKCLFPEGYKLKNYKKYSFANCLLECEMEYARGTIHILRPQILWRVGPHPS